MRSASLSVKEKNAKAGARRATNTQMMSVPNTGHKILMIDVSTHLIFALSPLSKMKLSQEVHGTERLVTNT